MSAPVNLTTRRTVVSTHRPTYARGAPIDLTHKARANSVTCSPFAIVLILSILSFLHCLFLSSMPPSERDQPTELCANGSVEQPMDRLV